MNSYASWNQYLSTLPNLKIMIENIGTCIKMLCMVDGLQCKTCTCNQKLKGFKNREIFVEFHGYFKKLNNKNRQKHFHGVPEIRPDAQMPRGFW